jgi:septum formation topological specificity factor MinE
LASAGCIFIKFDILSIFQKYVEKNLTSITGTLHEDQNMFLILSASVLLRMINVADRVVKEVKTHVV